MERRLVCIRSLFMVISRAVDACSYFLVLSYSYYVFIMCTVIFINVMYNLKDNFFLLSHLAHFYTYLYIMKNTHSIKYSRQPWEFLYLVLSAGFRHRKEKMYQQDITINNEFYTYRQSLQKNAYISTPLLNFKYHI